LPGFRKTTNVINTDLNRDHNPRINILIFWVLTILLTTGMVFSGWRADTGLSDQFYTISLQLTAQADQPSSFQTVSFETRDQNGEGVIDEPNPAITSFKVEAFNLTNRPPSFYRLKSHLKVAKDYQRRIFRLPNSPLSLNQILRI
jgi:hypothetical protein